MVRRAAAALEKEEMGASVFLEWGTRRGLGFWEESLRSVSRVSGIVFDVGFR